MHITGNPLRPWLKAILFVILLLLLGVLAWQSMPDEWFTPEAIEAVLQQMGVLAPVAFILIRVVAIIVTVVPNAPLDIAGGVIFGPFWGTVYSLIGSELGAIACFFIARSLGREAVIRVLHRDLPFADTGAQKELAFLVCFARLEPIFSFALVSYGAGLTRMSLTPFALGTLIGMTPGTILLTYYGKGLFTGNLLLQIGFGLLLVIMLLAIPLWLRHRHPGWHNHSGTDTKPSA